MSDDNDMGWYDSLLKAAEQFEDENNDLEAVLEGTIGFHTFYVAEGDDPTRGVQTAVYQGLYDSLEEMHVDKDTVQIDYGEVTPETVWQTVEGELDRHMYIPDSLRENIEQRVKSQVEDNLSD